jgi:acyl carrier protein
MLEPLLGERKPAAATPAASKRAEIAAAPLGERHGLLQAYLVDVIRRVLRIPAGKPLATDQPLNRFGIDSLMAVELRNRIEADLSLALPVSKILLCTGLDKLASELLESLAIAPAADSGGVIEPARAATPLERMLGDRQAEGDELLDDLIDEDVRIPA